MLVLKVGCNIKNKKFLLKPNSPTRSLCLKRFLSFRMPLFSIMASKTLWLNNRKHLKPKCGLLPRYSHLLWIQLFQHVGENTLKCHTLDVQESILHSLKNFNNILFQLICANDEMGFMSRMNSYIKTLC